MGYQGWKNYETWCVNLWLANEEPSYRYWRDAALDAWQEAPDDENHQGESPIWTLSECARFRLADKLKDEVACGVPAACAGTMWDDLLGAALDEVEWGEIANALLEDCEGYEYKTFAWDEQPTT